MRIIVHKFEILVLEIEDALYFRIYLHLRKLARLTAELKLDLLEMVEIDMGVSGRMDEVSRLKAANLSYHHG
jgi:hypothetical protein